MNTEKTRELLINLRSLIGGFLEPTRPLPFSVFIVSLWFSVPFQLNRNG